MAEKRPVVVYGVSGYTGRLVCEYLREYNIPFIAAGRDKKKVQEVVDKIPGIETADYEVVEVEHTVAALTKLFKGAKVVSNMVGPFIKYGSEVVEACLAAGCHYTDTTGEQDWVLKCADTVGRQVRRQGPAARPEHRADVHHRRNRRQYRAGDARPRHAGHPRLLEGLPDLRLDADNLHHPEGELVLHGAEEVPGVGRHREVGRGRFPASTIRPSPCHGAAPPILSGSATIPVSPTSRRWAAFSRGRSWRASSPPRRW